MSGTSEEPPIRILFVDDEQALLDALANALRRHRREWEMQFAHGGRAALDAMAQTRFDVVVTDMRMPEIDGVAVLAAARATHPSTVRLVLTGQTDRSAAINSIGNAHQLLSKPCSAETIYNVVTRLARHRAAVVDRFARRAAGSVGYLPVSVAEYTVFSAALAAPDTVPERVAQAVMQSPGVSAKLLQLVNGGFFGHGRATMSIPEAVGYLGIEVLRDIPTLAAPISDPMASLQSVGFDFARLERHSVFAGRLARRILEGVIDPDLAYTAGVLSQIGLTTLAMSFGDELAAVIRKSIVSGRSLRDVEVATYQLGHAEVGAYLLGLWGLPDTLTSAIAAQRNPSAQRATPTFGLTCGLHVANALSMELMPLYDDPSLVAETLLDVPYVTACGVADRLPEWHETGEALLTSIPKLHRAVVCR